MDTSTYEFLRWFENLRIELGIKNTNPTMGEYLEAVYELKKKERRLNNILDIVENSAGVFYWNPYKKTEFKAWNEFPEVIEAIVLKDCEN